MKNMSERQLFQDNARGDPRLRKRVVPMQVLNMSFQRTGTMSMYKALEILGYDCWHSIQFFNNIADVPMWIEALDAKYHIHTTPKAKQQQRSPFTRTEWDQLLSHHSAVSSDSPAIAFAEDLITAYPDAKVILHERDVDAWYRSFEKAIIDPFFNPVLRTVSNLDPWYTGQVRDVHHDWARAHLGITLASKQEMRDAARPAYRAHYDLVRRVTPPERLLEFNIEQGWAPLCAFLNKPVPRDEATGEELPFPKINDQDAMREMLAAIALQGFKNFLKRTAKWVVPVAVVGLGVGWYVRWW